LIAAARVLVSPYLEAIPDDLGRFVDGHPMTCQLLFVKLVVELVGIKLLPETTTSFYPTPFPCGFAGAFTSD
jgi:hypothetical protein